VLNIGVGDASFEALAAAAGHDLSTLDPSAQAIARLAQARGETRCRVGYSQAIPWSDGSFECVVMSEVLEHLDDATLAATVREVRRVLTPGGRFIGTVPADEDLALNQTVCPHCGIRFHRFGHLRSFSSEAVRAALAGGGFARPRVVRRSFPDFSKRSPLALAKSCASWVLGRLGERIADPHYYFEASPGAGAS
jgi:SAM-dependent methyltransferase